MLEPRDYQKAARDLSYALLKKLEQETGAVLGEGERQRFEAWVEPLLEQFEFEVIGRVEDELDAWECDGNCEEAEQLRAEIEELERLAD